MLVGDAQTRAQAFREAQLLLAGTDLDGDVKNAIVVADWLIDPAAPLMMSVEATAMRVGNSHMREVP